MKRVTFARSRQPQVLMAQANTLDLSRLVRRKINDLGNTKVPLIHPLYRGVLNKGAEFGPPEKNKKQGEANLASILTATKELNREDRKQLLAHLSLDAARPQTGEERDVDMWSGAVYTALVDAIGQQGGVVAGPLVIKRLAGLPSAWTPVQEFMNQSKLSKLTVTERQGVYQLLAKLVVKRAQTVSRRADIPLSSKLVVSTAQGVGAVFDSAFPGYLASGLAPFVAKQLVALQHAA